MREGFQPLMQDKRGEDRIRGSGARLGEAQNTKPWSFRTVGTVMVNSRTVDFDDGLLCALD